VLFTWWDGQLRSAVGDRGMQVIGESCKQLKRIRVDHINSEYMTDYVTQKGMIAICEGCRELDFLVMYLSDVNNEALAAVGRCLPKLTDFRIVLLEVRFPALRVCLAVLSMSYGNSYLFVFSLSRYASLGLYSTDLWKSCIRDIQYLSRIAYPRCL